MSTIICHVQSGFKPDKTLLISILYIKNIKNTNKAVTIVVVFEAV
jgi:hypothetical protein